MGWQEVHLIIIQLWHKNTIRIHSGNAHGRMLNQELLRTEIPEVSLVVFACRLFHKDFMTS